jgi:PII-like signaling protein
MRIEGPALLVRVFVGESDKWRGKNLYLAIVELLRERGLAGATVLRGSEGFGAKQHRHTTRILSLSLDLPIVVEAIDREDKVRAILPELDAMVGDGLIVVQPVEVVAHRSEGTPG